MLTSLPAFAPFFAGAVAVALLRGWPRHAVLLAIPVVGGLNLLGVPEGTTVHAAILDYELTLYRVDRLSLLFGYLFHIAAFLGIVFSLHLRGMVQHPSGLLYAGSALGAVFAGDLITLLVFWELMAMSSVFLIWARRTPRATSAGFRYLFFQIASGLILLAGVLLHVSRTGSIVFEYMGLDGRASWMFFLAFSIKAAFPLVHNWLTDTYPEATPTGTVFLSAFSTKVAVYALARAFPGAEILIYIGAVMACFPIFYAVIENDLRRVLGYSVINQIGFMVCGVGIGTALAINGAVSHLFAHVIYKSLLFMSMGAVLHMTGKTKGTDLGGLYKTMPVTAGFCIVGAASIAVPLFSGFVSKSMVMAAALEEGYHWVWLALLVAAVGVWHNAGIKVPFLAFFAHDSGIRVGEPPINMLIAMALAAALCVFIGSYPWLLYSLLPFPVEYDPYTSTHVIAQLQLLFFSGLAFAWLKLTGLHPPELRGVNIDADWTYRSLGPRVVRALTAVGSPVDARMRLGVRRRVETVIGALFRYHGPRGILARTWTTGSMALWVAILLGLSLLFYY